MHSVGLSSLELVPLLGLLVDLTARNSRTHGRLLVDSGALRALLLLPALQSESSRDPPTSHVLSAVSVVLRNVVEQPTLLRQAMETEIVRWFSEAARVFHRHRKKRSDSVHSKPVLLPVVVFASVFERLMARNPTMFKETVVKLCQFQTSKEKPVMGLKPEFVPERSEKQQQQQQQSKPSESPPETKTDADRGKKRLLLPLQQQQQQAIQQILKTGKHSQTHFTLLLKCLPVWPTKSSNSLRVRNATFNNTVKTIKFRLIPSMPFNR
eukprot:GABV01000277.1.p1 GENE.GABV01000277.1~~GABV01000277.1.p1  ORF type:complete len:267 (-),score=73.85 GABV01000277.1:178-978(-)